MPVILLALSGQIQVIVEFDAQNDYTNSIRKSSMHSQIDARFKVLSDDPQQSIDDYLSQHKLVGLTVSVPSQLQALQATEGHLPRVLVRHTVCHLFTLSPPWPPT